MDIDEYWLDGNFYFDITSGGLIQSTSPLALGNYSITIHVNDTSGNEISTSITVTVIDQGSKNNEFYKEPWFLFLIAGIAVVSGTAAGIARKQRKKPRDGRSGGGFPSNDVVSTSGSQGIQGGGAIASKTAESMADGVGAPKTPLGPPKTPLGGTKFYCTTCNAPYTISLPAGVESATCPTCNGVLNNLIRCSACNYEMMVDKEFMATYRGKSISCSNCGKNFIL
ncbi:MAG: hypothetical protein ACTSUE_05935 [Promethearchaeota archaeon]